MRAGLPCAQPESVATGSDWSVTSSGTVQYDHGLQLGFRRQHPMGWDQVQPRPGTGACALAAAAPARQRSGAPRVICLGLRAGRPSACRAVAEGQPGLHCGRPSELPSVLIDDKHLAVNDPPNVERPPVQPLAALQAADSLRVRRQGHRMRRVSRRSAGASTVSKASNTPKAVSEPSVWSTQRTAFHAPLQTFPTASGKLTATTAGSNSQVPWSMPCSS